MVIIQQKYKQMKKKHILLYIAFAAISLQAGYTQNRVGINTEDPEQLFHIDAKANTVKATESTKTDDVVVTANGAVAIGATSVPDNKKLYVAGDSYVKQNATANDTLVVDSLSFFSKIGVGTDSPQAHLHIANTGNDVKFRLSDTSERDGYMLTADENGNASWEPLRPMSSVVVGNVKGGVVIYPYITGATYNGPYVVSDTIQLPPGKWLIMANSQTRGTLNWDGAEFTMYFRLYVDYKGIGDTSQNPDYAVTTSSTTDYNTTNHMGRTANPQLMYVLDIPVPFDSSGKLKPSDSKYLTKVWLQMVSSGRYGVTTGAGSFYAIRIDRYTR